MDQKSYLVIARKYRPKTFDDVIGQDAAVTTLKNAITSERIGHAYLFTGPRGVGKTSMARIFAKALNCKKGPTASPCGECPACAEIDQSRALDVLEIDGASNRGIDEIRALRENIKFAPASGRYKIYIIDEVHQITTDGFNALLKTLEEPPAHVKFIFATTSANKVPATILSRCQRFDFRRIPTDTLAKTLKDIAKREKIKITEEAIFLIARAGDGSFRDSQSILDQIASSSKGEIGAAEVVRSLGVLEDEKLVEMTDALIKKDSQNAIILLDALIREGREPVLFMERLLEHIRNLLCLKTAEGLASVIEAAEAYKEALSRQKNELTKEELFYFFNVIQTALQGMRRFESKRVPIEVALLKLSNRVPMQDIAALTQALKDFEKKSQVRSSASATPPPANKASSPQVSSVDLPKVQRPKPAQERAEDEDEALQAQVIDEEEGDPSAEAAWQERSGGVTLDSVWQALIAAIKNEKISVASFLSEGSPIGIVREIVKIGFPEKFSFHRETLELPENRRLIEKHLRNLLVNQSIRVEFEPIKSQAGEEDNSASQSPVPQEPVQDSESVKNAMNIFGGRIIRS